MIRELESSARARSQNGANPWKQYLAANNPTVLSAITALSNDRRITTPRTPTGSRGRRLRPTFETISATSVPSPKFFSAKSQPSGEVVPEAVLSCVSLKL